METTTRRSNVRGSRWAARWAGWLGAAITALAIGAMQTGCNPPAGGGGGSADQQQNLNGAEANENEAGPSDGNVNGDTLDLSLDVDPDSKVYARIRDADGTEFAIFAEKDAGGTVPAGRQASAVNTRFPEGDLHKSVLDTDGRPVNIDTPDLAAGIVYRTAEGGRNKMLLVDREGTDTVIDLDIDETVGGLDESETAQADPRLCDRVEHHVAILEQIVAGCADGDTSPCCDQALRRLAETSKRLCTRPARETDVELDAQVEGVIAGAECVVLEDAPGVADLNGTAAGGTPPYEFAWDLVRAAPYSYSEIENADSQFARLQLESFGEYVLRLSVTDDRNQEASAICFVERVPTEAEEFAIQIIIETGYSPEGIVQAGSTLALSAYFLVEVTDPFTITWSILPEEAGTFNPATADVTPIFLELSEDFEGDMFLTVQAVRAADGRTTEDTWIVQVVQ